MKHLISFAIFVSLIFGSSTCLAKSGIFKTINLLGTQQECSDKINVSSMKKACQRKENWGKSIYKCKYKCPKGQKCKKGKGKTYIATKARVCNSDGEKKGYYLNSCSGERIEAKSLKKACGKKKAKGQVVVKCKNGKEKKRQSCSSAKNNKGKYETRVFVNKCGGKVAKKNRREIRRNLNKACRTGKYNGKVLVKCTNKCVKRKGIFDCQKRAWIEKERALCGGDKKKAEIKNCTEEQSQDIADAYKSAKKELSPIINQMKKFLENPNKKIKDFAHNPNMGKKKKEELIKHVKKALKNAEQIQKRLDKKPKFECVGDQKGLCGKGYEAYVSISRKKSQYCNSFFTERDGATGRGRTIAHELSHNVGTRDHTYSQDEIKDIKWWNNASSFNTWMKHGKFCIPGWKDCF